MSAAKICPQCGTEYTSDVRFCPRDGATLRAPKSDDLVGQVVADRYHIVSKIGEGGMGQVYLAEHVRMKRKSAVKVMSPRLAQDPDAIQRFNREASNACQIAHPNVAAVYDFGETDEGMIYLAMEYIEGEPLTNVIRRQGALPAARAADITRQTADGLGAAHELGIVHRDLKPDNIMIARRRDGADFVKVVDFGIAKAIEGDDQKVTKTGLAVGTPEYMSPEQLAGDRLDPRTDIYSLGLVSFAMFTGSLPFPAVTSKEAMIMRLTERPRTLAQMRPDVAWPASLQRVFDLALANDSRSRYQDVTEFGRDVVSAAAELRSAAGSEVGTAVMPRLDTPAPSAPRLPTLPPPTQPAVSHPLVTPDSATEVRPAARDNAATQMMQTPDPQPGRTAAPRGPGDITPSPMPPAGTPPVDLTRAPQLQATGMMPAFRAPTPSHSTAGVPRTPVPAAAPAPVSSGGRGALWTAIGIGSLLVLGAGGWFALRPKTANPPSAAETPAVAPPVDAPATTASGRTTTLPPVTPPAPAGGSSGTPTPTPGGGSTTKAAPAVAEPRWADTLRPIQAEFQAARSLFEEGDYAAAVQRLRGARTQVETLVSRYPAARPVRQLRDRIDRQIGEVRTACGAEAAAAARRGRTIQCP